MKKGIAKLNLLYLAAGMVFGNASAAVSADEAAAGRTAARRVWQEQSVLLIWNRRTSPSMCVRQRTLRQEKWSVF